MYHACNILTALRCTPPLESQQDYQIPHGAASHVNDALPGEVHIERSPVLSQLIPDGRKSQEDYAFPQRELRAATKGPTQTFAHFSHGAISKRHDEDDQG